MKSKIVNLFLALALILAVGAAFATPPGHEDGGNGQGHDRYQEAGGMGLGHIKHDVSPG